MAHTSDSNWETLEALLEGNGVQPSVREWMKSNGCTDVKKFANWVDEGKELKVDILAKVDAGLRTNSAQYASLKQAWRESESLVQRGLKRHSEGLSHESLDEPLAEKVQEQVEKSFSTLYFWVSSLKPFSVPRANSVTRSGPPALSASMLLGFP